MSVEKLRIGVVGVSLWASTGYGVQTRGIVHTLANAGREVVSIAHEADVMVWGGTKTYKYDDGLSVKTFIITSPIGSVEAKKKANDILQLYTDSLKLDLLIGHWDSVPSDSPLLVRKSRHYEGLSSVDVTTMEDLWDKTEGAVSTTSREEQIKTLQTSVDIPVTKQRWTKITKMIRHPAQGNILRLNSYGGLLDITPNHSIYLKTKHQFRTVLYDASKVKVGDRLSEIETRLSGSTHDGGYERVRPTFFVGSPDLAWFYGFFVAEGHASIIGKHGYVIISNSESSLIEKARSIFEGNFHVATRTYRDKKGINQIGNDSSAIAFYFRNLFYTGDGKKKVPEVILNSNSRVKSAFLEGYLAGDGAKPSSTYGKYEFETNSKCLAEGLRLLVKELSGIDCSIHLRPNKPNIIRLYAPKDAAHPSFKDRTLVKSINPIYYSGYLYDLETEEHTFTTGVGAFKVHNSFALEFLQDQQVPYIVYIPVESKMTRKWYDYVKNAFHIVCYSRYGYEQMLNFAPPSKVSFIPHGIDCDTFKPLDMDKPTLRRKIEAHPPIPDDCFLFTSVGANLGPRKQFPQMLDTFKEFSETHEDAHLYLHTNPTVSKIGEGYDLLNKIDELELSEKVHVPTVNPILVSKTDAEMAEIYNASDAYITNSLGEGFGIPILEAMASGIPAVAPRNSSHVELVEGVGWLADTIPESSHRDYFIHTPYNSYFTVADQRSMLRMMETAYTSIGKFRNEYAKKCRRRALEYDWKAIAPKWVELVERVSEDLSIFRTIRWK